MVPLVIFAIAISAGPAAAGGSSDTLRSYLDEGAYCRLDAKTKYPICVRNDSLKGVRALQALTFCGDTLDAPPCMVSWTARIEDEQHAETRDLWVSFIEEKLPNGTWEVRPAVDAFGATTNEYLRIAERGDGRLLDDFLTLRVSISRPGFLSSGEYLSNPTKISFSPALPGCTDETVLRYLHPMMRRYREAKRSDAFAHMAAFATAYNDHPDVSVRGDVNVDIYFDGGVHQQAVAEAVSRMKATSADHLEAYGDILSSGAFACYIDVNGYHNREAEWVFKKAFRQWRRWWNAEGYQYD